MSTDRMVVVTGGNVQDYDLKSFGTAHILVGRSSEECNIVIPSPKVSSVHLRLKYDSRGVLHIADVGSTNGTWSYYENQYVRMPAKKYIRRRQTDMILRIDSSGHDAAASVLIVITGSSASGCWVHKQLEQGNTTLGRGAENNIVIDSPSFSRRHAIFSRNGEQTAVSDCHSMNGVYVNGRRIGESTLLHEKDVIQIAGNLFILAGNTLLFQKEANGVSLRLENVSKVVGQGKKEKAILQHVSCLIGSNEFVAIIGGSGAGKTTVMNAMSGFDSEVMGNVYCNGIDLHKNFAVMKNMIGFVPQQDIIYENLTLQNMLGFTAKLKMPSDSSGEERDRRIHQVLQMVDLAEHKDTYIRKLSGGQKKRASIAVELLADPGLFFLDEPTSGLDPDTEQSLMHTLAELSKSEGKTIIMVTHTTQSIHLCDKVIFMGPGGKICYCGPPSELVNYFGKKELVEVYSEVGNNVDLWNGYYFYNYKMQEPQQKVNADTGPLTKRKGRQVSPVRQLAVLISRYSRLIINDSQRLLLLFLQPVVIALLLIVVANEKIFITYEDTQSMMFALACSGIWIGMFNTIQEVCKERAILKREYMGNLNLVSYILSKFCVQSFICLLQSGVLTFVFLSLAENKAGDGLFCENTNMEIWFSVYLTVFASSAMGLIISSLVRNSDRAMAVSPFVLIIQLLFSGAIFTLPAGAGEWLSKLTVSRWAMECLGNITNLNGLPRRMAYEDDNLAALIPPHHDDLYARSSEHLWYIWVVLLLVSVVCGVISVLVLRSLKKDHR